MHRTRSKTHVAKNHLKLFFCEFVPFEIRPSQNSEEGKLLIRKQDCFPDSIDQVTRKFSPGGWGKDFFPVNFKALQKGQKSLLSFATRVLVVAND